MKLINFGIVDGYAIEAANQKLDLHNDFDFVGFSYQLDQNAITLDWSRNDGDWVGDDVPLTVSLNFEKVSVILVEYCETGHPKCDSQTLSFIGFLHPEDIGIMDGYLDCPEREESWHAIVGFEDGLRLKCYSETVSCTLG